MHRVFAGAALSAASLFAASGLHEFTMKTIDGRPQSLAAFRGKVVLVVNVASRCGHTPQYAGLEALYRKYKDRGLVVAGFPANNFGAQEPGSDSEIREFCSRTYGVTFPMFSKISVKGEDTAPLYRFLTAAGGDVKWNFTKFLVGKDGQVVRKFESKTAPDAADLTGAIEEALAR